MGVRRVLLLAVGGVAEGVAGGSRRGCRGGDVALGVAGGA